MNTSRTITFFLYSLLLSVTNVNAEVVNIDHSSGNGFIFEARGHCLLVLPQHVRENVGNPNLLSFSTKGKSGRAGYLDHNKEKDFALMKVQQYSGSIRNCSKRTWESLNQIDSDHMVSQLLGGKHAKLLYRDSTGTLVDQKVINFTRSERGRDYLEGTTASAYTGLSGSTVYLEDNLVGMTVTANNIPNPDGNSTVELLRFGTLKAAIKPQIQDLAPVLPITPEPKTPSLTNLETSKIKRYWWIPVLAVGLVYAATQNDGDRSTPGNFSLNAPFPQP